LSSTGATAAVGFVFWWIAAKYFSQGAVGAASAAISLMSFLALLGEFGLGTLLYGESLRKPDKSAGLISAAIIAVVISSSALCLGYLTVAHLYPATFKFGSSLNPDLSSTVLLAGCAITGLTMVLDSAFVGLLRSLLQTWRTFLASAFKLTLLLAAAYAGFAGGANTIVLALIGGQALSVLVVVGLIGHRDSRIWQPPNFRLLWRFGRNAVGHQLLNLAEQSPSLVMPVLVASILSAEVNAAFYAAWMVFNVIALGPASLTTLLFTIGVVEPTLIRQRLIFSLWVCALASPIVWGGLMIGADHILGVFGPAYAAQGGPALKILGIAIFPVAIKFHYIAIQRLSNSMASASLVLFAGAIVELAAASFGARLGGLEGFVEGWVVAIYLEALVMVPALIRFARRSARQAAQGQDQLESRSRLESRTQESR
jgi:O-antigen/teichoic acid export membrane protein